jgi:low temperature requirement protein LtrA
MFGVIILAQTLEDVAHGAPFFFVLTYAALRLLLIGLYVWVWHAEPQARGLALHHSRGFAAALVLWLISFWVTPPVQYWLWGSALLIERVTGPVVYAQRSTRTDHFSHMDERFGLFVILVLGEAIIGVSTGVAGAERHWPHMITAIGGFALAIGLWWLYFVRARADAVNVALRDERSRGIGPFVVTTNPSLALP